MTHESSRAEREGESRARLEARNTALRGQVERRAEALDVLHEITRASNEAGSPEEAISAALRIVCRHNAWEIGHAWALAEETPERFVSTGVWHVGVGVDATPLRTATAEEGVEIGDGFVGSVVARGAPIHVPDLAAFPGWRRGSPESLGIRSAMGFPVLIAGRTVAVLEFFHSRPMVLDSIFMAIMMDVGVQVGHAIERQRLEREIAARSDRERQQLAQEVHDNLGQQMAGATLVAGSLARALAREGSPRAEDAKKLVRELEEAKLQLRALSKGLLPVEIEPGGLRHALHDLVETAHVGFPDLEIRFECDPEAEIADGVAATQLYRIAQEALYNATRHASARTITVRLSGSPVLELEVRDDGVGIPDPLPPGTGSGLRIMRHRAGLIGGMLRIERLPGGGTSLRSRVRV